MKDEEADEEEEVEEQNENYTLHFCILGHFS